jgi:protein TonB
MAAQQVPSQTNGIHPGGPGVARASLMGDREPLNRVLELGSRAWTTVTVALLVATIAHGVLGARAALASLELLRFARNVQARVAQRLADTYDIEELQKPPEPPPLPEPEPEPAKAAPPPPAQKEEAPPPPPPAAAAGQVITSEPDPNEPVDMTSTFISVPGGDFAGGTTQAGGTSTKPVTGPGRAGGVPGGTGTAPAPAPVGPDRTRAASFNGSTEWNCPWPQEADAEQVDEAYVTVEVAVNADGRPSQVAIVKDPGHGFARKARECAMSKTFTTALDREGKAIPGKTKPFRIHFER